MNYAKSMNPMKETRLMMGMPITVEIIDTDAPADSIDVVFDYFNGVDEKFSTYKPNSEISRINQNRMSLRQASKEMRTIFELAEQTKQETYGYFDIERNGAFDPSGLVKGWAIYSAAELLRRRGVQNFYVDAGGDIQTAGHNGQGQRWRVGIRNPFNIDEIVKVLLIEDQGVATSGNTIRGAHIYNPRISGDLETEIVSLTVIGPNIYDADRFATAAYAMGRPGITFIENLAGFEGYMIDNTGKATFTSGFEGYTHDA